MDFLETRLFDGMLLTGTSGGPRWSTTIVATASGTEKRNAAWSRQRAHFDVGGRLVNESELAQIISHFNAVQGMAMGFRWRDIGDYTIARSESFFIQLSATAYQLYKNYGVAGQTRQRKISKPISDDFLLWINGVASTSYTLDTTTGIVTVLPAPVGSPPLVVTTIEASGEFDIPVRFDTDELVYTYAGGPVGSAGYDLSTLAVVELKL